MKMAHILVLIIFALGACGIKPDAVEPPSGQDSDTFPRHYPTQP